MRQIAVIVTLYVSRRKRCGCVPGEKGEITDQVWLVVEVRCVGEACTCPEADLAPVPGSTEAKTFDEQLRDAVAENAADSFEQRVWDIDDLSGDQLASFAANFPDLVKSMVSEPLGRIAGEVGMPVAGAAFGADVSATLLLKPVLEPLERAVHAVEVAGIVVGLVTGLHPLAVICAKHLAHDELGSAMATGTRQLMTGAGAREARPMLPTVRSFARESGSGVSTMQSGGGEPLSPQHQRQLEAVLKGRLGNVSMPENAPQAKLSASEMLTQLTADDDDEAETPSLAAGLADTADDPADLGSAT